MVPYLYKRLAPYRAAIRVGLLPTLLLLMAGTWWLVHATGGAKFVYTHSMYLPVLASGLVYGLRAGILTGIAGGIILGPLMPLDVATGEWQTAANWLYRTGFFVLVGGIAGMVRDSVEVQLDRLRWQAGHDSVTGLPNRMALIAALEKLPQPGSGRAIPVLCIVSVENSDELSSALGYGVIEDNVRQLARRAALHLPATTEIYRVATEQIGFLGECRDAAVPEFMNGITDAFRQPFDYNGIPIHIDTRIGYVAITRSGREPESYLRQAQSASLLASRNGQDFVQYHRGIHRQTRENLAVLGELTGGLERGEICLHYQPKVSVRTGVLCGAEALMRWDHPERGRIPPGSFIPRAEQSTLIHSLTEFAIATALRQAVAWRDAGFEVPVAVNVSPRDLLRPGFSALVSHMVQSCGATPDLLELEVTEGEVIGDVERVVEELQRLAAAGIRVAIDDFGTGYSSLTYVHRLPVSFLKIDQSFIRRLLDEASESSIDIVEAVVSVAHKKGIVTIAEGVENDAIYARLAGLDCDIAQGYAIAPPMPAAEFEAWCAKFQGHVKQDQRRVARQEEAPAAAAPGFILGLAGASLPG